MSSLLSGILVCLFFEFLVSSYFKSISPQNSFYFRCIYPENTVLFDLVYKCNNIETLIDFTFESNNILLSLNMLHRTNNYLQAYRTNKENRTNFHSHHYQIYHFDRFSDLEIKFSSIPNCKFEIITRYVLRLVYEDYFVVSWPLKFVCY